MPSEYVLETRSELKQTQQIHLVAKNDSEAVEKALSLLGTDKAIDRIIVYKTVISLDQTP